MLTREMIRINCIDASSCTGSIWIASHSTSAASMRRARPPGRVSRLEISQAETPDATTTNAAAMGHAGGTPLHLVPRTLLSTWSESRNERTAKLCTSQTTKLAHARMIHAALYLLSAPLDDSAVFCAAIDDGISALIMRSGWEEYIVT